MIAIKIPMYKISNLLKVDKMWTKTWTKTEKVKMSNYPKVVESICHIILLDVGIQCKNYVAISISDILVK